MTNQQSIIATVVSKDGKTFLESDIYPKNRIFFKFQWLRERGNIQGRAEVGDQFKIIVQPSPNGLGLEVAEFIDRIEQVNAESFTHTPNIIADNSNFALFINKPPELLITTEWGLKKYSKQNKKIKQQDKEDPKESRNVGEAINNFRFNAQQIKSINTRQASYVATVCQTPAKIETGLHANSRLAIGLGTASVYETGMLLHAVYGFPYIPASSVKGVVRSYIISEVFGNDEVKALEDKTFCDIFGCSGEGKIEVANFKSHYKIAAEETKAKDNGDRQGNVVFFEAFPTDSVKVKIDVMTPHYGDYYGDKVDEKTKLPMPPADYLSPNPITFLTVEGTKFTFHFGLLLGEENILVRFKDKDVGNKEEKQPILSLVNHWLTQALTQHGIGAKTAVGYGYMQ